MSGLQKTGIVVGLIVPLLAGAWWAGSGYVEVSDRLTALENDVGRMKDDVADLQERQIEDRFVNKQVEQLAEQVDYLRRHHHDEHGGLGHVD